jgi:ferredoxin-type protein NapH
VFGFVWAITLLTYLLPPADGVGQPGARHLSANQARFLGVGTLVFTLEFTLARHLFCRFGCAVGLFQSLAWMANPKAMVVSFTRSRARECKTCEVLPTPLDNAAQQRRARAPTPGPRAQRQRLRPRLPHAPEPAQHQTHDVCLRAVRPVPDACDTTQTDQGRTPTLEWKVGLDAVRETLRQKREEIH